MGRGTQRNLVWSADTSLSGMVSIALGEAYSLEMYSLKRTILPDWLVLALTMLAMLTMVILAVLTDGPE
jgi:hypothetical protein